MEEEEVGIVVKFFSKPSVAAIEVTGDQLSIGDTVHFKGHTTDFEEEIASMQVEKEAIEVAKRGSLVGIKVKDRVREGDKVYRAKA
jgi:putative protease